MYHVSAFSRENVGDLLLPAAIRDLFSNEFEVKRWKGLPVYSVITDKLVNHINQSDTLVIGGGGLFLKDTNPNQLSGWQWSCSIEQLKKINKPIILYAIGYNRFRYQEDFDPIFKEHLNALVSKAAFVGIRNTGSILKLREYLTNESDKTKLRLQPCITTLISKLYPDLTDYYHKKNYIAVNCAFDRQNLRFKSTETLEAIARVVKELASITTIRYFSHMKSDQAILPYFKAQHIEYELVEFKSVRQIIETYAEPRLVIGMRGHAQMIPFGCLTPIISIISHDKLKWFLEDIGHPEWGVDVLDEAFESKLLGKSFYSYYQTENLLKAISVEQEKIWSLTKKNSQLIQTILNDSNPGSKH